MEVISTVGTPGRAALSSGNRDCIIALESGTESLARLRGVCPHVVVTSNRASLDGFPQVISDDREVGRIGAAYLLNRGFSQLVFLSVGDGSTRDADAEFAFSRERRSGFLEAAQAAGAEVRTYSLSTANDAFRILPELEHFSGQVGVMAASDLHARWAIEAFEDPRVVIPSNFAVLGVDDDPLEAALCPIGLSSVRLAGEQIGYEAAALGMRLASGERQPDAPIRIRPLTVVTRQSTSVFATDDAMVARALRLMRDRMAELADASDVVKASGVPRRTLEWHFNRALQSSVARELSRARLRRARELLMTTELSIKEIAYLVGFSEPRMLSIVFRRETGETPSDFRQRVRPGNPG
jgi:LacI family transcriptional regulator